MPSWATAQQVEWKLGLFCPLDDCSLPLRALDPGPPSFGRGMTPHPDLATAERNVSYSPCPRNRSLSLSRTPWRDSSGRLG